jgi:sodium pump decarboxylase gamma subunit
MLSLAACGDNIKYDTVAGSKYDETTFNKENLTMFAENIEDSWFEGWFLSDITPDNFEDNLYDGIVQSFDEETFAVILAGYKNWYDAVEEIGYSSPATLADDISVKSIKYYINRDGELMVDAIIEGTGEKAHSAILEYSLDRKGKPLLISVNVNHSTGEKLASAGLNTLLGMGMAFAVLIIIALVISAFPLIGKLAEKKPETDKAITKQSMENVTAQIADKEDLSEDAELVAVIAAAIAAYEGSASTDGYVVRSIRKRSASNWKKA